MSQKPEKTTTQDMQLTPDYQAWRDEVESFCRQTIVHLQEFIEAVESDQPAELKPPPVEDSPRVPLAAAPTPTATPATAPPVATDATHGDLDTSQDRLANLKRQLAAKLSNVKREQ